MSTATDQVFNESVLRLQGWVTFLEQKESEFQTQLERVRRTQQQTPTKPIAIAEAETPAAEEDAWQ